MWGLTLERLGDRRVRVSALAVAALAAALLGALTGGTSPRSIGEKGQPTATPSAPGGSGSAPAVAGAAATAQVFRPLTKGLLLGV